MNKKIIYTLTAFLGISLLVLNACKKDDMPNKTAEVYWTAEDVRIQNSILNFQSKIKNNSFKNGESIKIDSALWYLEALLNFNYSTPDSSFVNLTVDTSFIFELPTNNEEVDFNDLVSAAFAMEDHILSFYEQMPEAIKFIIATDVKIKETDTKLGGLTLTITTGYGSEYIDNPACYPPFGEYDYWKWGASWMDFGGYCDGPYVGQDEDSDAAEEIEKKINSPRCIGTDIGHPYYIAEVYTVHILPEAYPNPDDDGLDNYQDFLLYNGYTGINVPNICIPPEDMNFYLQGTLDVVLAESQIILINNPTESWKFLNIDLMGNFMTDDDETWYFHEAFITFGRRVSYVPPID